MGRKEKTVGGLQKSSLKMNKRGKVVSVKQSNQGKKAFKSIKKWADALKKARKNLKIKGFVPVGGKTRQGQQLLAEVRRNL